LTVDEVRAMRWLGPLDKSGSAQLTGAAEGLGGDEIE